MYQTLLQRYFSVLCDKNINRAIGGFGDSKLIMKKERLDFLLVARGFFDSREKAKRAVMAGAVRVDNRASVKPGALVDTDCVIIVLARQKYVSRGGDKLEAALRTFDVSAGRKRCLDIGASTGGFTDCLLQNGASAVITVDVGYGQLDQRLRNDHRVTVLDRVNARYLTRDQLPFVPELVTVDVSFISLAKVLPAVYRLMAADAPLPTSSVSPHQRVAGEVVALVKPQFEAGRRFVKRGGVVKDPRIHALVLTTVCEEAQKIGFAVKGMIASPLLGPAGNREFFVHLTLHIP
jgi:23S rRNA (cytidine1920-2'-O)/16S rRNA (cytidine1409-2'-O)-methyltransferase